MNGRIKGALTVAVLALAAACSDRGIVAPDGPMAAKSGTTYPMTFNVTQDYGTAQAATATGGAGVIDFTGTLQTPTPCYDLTAVNQAGRSIVVTVTATDLGGICMQVITWNNYTGQLTGMVPGSYAFKVVHVTGRQSSTAWSGTVVVR
jgi:hypothetical protein